MSKLLYAERGRSVEKYLFFALSIVGIGSIMFLTFLFVTGSDSASRSLELLAWTIPVIVLSIFGLLFLLERKRFEIYDNRIVLPYPRKRWPPLAGLFKADTLMKSEVQEANLEILREDGMFETKIPGCSSFGQEGEWRCTFLLKDGETFKLDWSQVKCKEECIPSLKEFIRGLENERS